MGKENGCVEETVKHRTHDRNQEINSVPQQFNMYTKSLWSIGREGKNLARKSDP